MNSTATRQLRERKAEPVISRSPSPVKLPDVPLATKDASRSPAVRVTRGSSSKTSVKAMPKKSSDKSSVTPIEKKSSGAGNALLVLFAVAAASLGMYYMTPSSSLNSTSSTPASSDPVISKSPSSNPVSSDGMLQLTDAQLSAFTGVDETKPIYVALNQTIFDVSASPAFYGPGGHYHHFAGKDATRAWVSTCFKGEEQLTWDMRGVDEMFRPKWMDEEIEEAAQGQGEGGALKEQALKALEKVGRVGEEEKAKRRTEDAKEMRDGVEGSIAHWMKFFKGNPKYKEVGRVVGRTALNEGREEIKLCEDALKKRPVRGGRFGSVMDKVAGQGKQEAPQFARAKAN